METVNIKNKAAKDNLKAPLLVTFKTASGNYVSMKQITPSEIKALRNSSYLYLA